MSDVIVNMARWACLQYVQWKPAHPTWGDRKLLEKIIGCRYDTIPHPEGARDRVLEKLEEITSLDMLAFIVLRAELEIGDDPDDLDRIKRSLRTEVNKKRLGEVTFSNEAILRINTC